MPVHLYPHQVDALWKMKNGCVLCGGVGSGKSITSLCYYVKFNGGHINSEGLPELKWKPLDLYIITTARKRDTLEWESELTKLCMHPDYTVFGQKIVIDSWNNIEKYKNVKGAFFIFDEQRVSGKGKWSRIFIKLSKENNWILLSATPGDKWEDYIPVFIANGFYKNRKEFEDSHIIYSRFAKYPKVDRYVNTGRLIRLRNSILIDMPFIRDAQQHEVIVKPGYDISKYRECMRTRFNPYTGAPIETAGEFCQTLRHIVGESVERQEAVLDIFREHPKIIVFYNYDYERDILLGLPYGSDVEIAEWSGHAHQPIPESDKWVYLVNYNAGAEGWNCIKTDTIIFYSQNYSYRIMVQAKGRIDRLNTPFTDLYYYIMRSKSDIDMAIAGALKSKKKFNESAFERSLA